MSTASILVVNMLDGRRTKFPCRPDETIQSLVQELVQGGFLPDAWDGYRIVLRPENRELAVAQLLADLMVTPDSRLEIARRGAYAKRITRKDPGLILFVIDQSESMSDELKGGTPKAAFLADVLNKTLMELVIRCTEQEGVFSRYHLGVIAYSGAGVGPGFGGALTGNYICDIADVSRSPLRVETRKRKVPDGAGGLAEIEVRFPVWFDPHAKHGTPMCQALRRASDLVADWCQDHQSSFPPVVLHITDGEPTDGTLEDVQEAAQGVISAGTSDGATLLLNLHLTRAGSGEPVRYPISEAALKSNYAKMLFRISSVLPPALVELGKESGIEVQSGSRGYVYNAGVEEIVNFFQIGTRPADARPGGADR